MKILLALASPEYLRFYDETVLELARRGHEVVVAVSVVREGKPVRLEAVAGVHPKVAIGGLIPVRADLWLPLVRAIRGTMDFLRYLHPSLAQASALRARVKRQALPWPLARLDRTEALESATVTRWMARLARLERAVPVARETMSFLREHRPDLLLVSPLVEVASDQVDLVRSAQAVGIPVGTLVASLDNLTNKGDLRVATDRVFVWNEAQKREAVELHRVDADAVVVSGAPVCDRWFGRRPSLDRLQFCRLVGLPTDATFVLFTGSSIFVARAEVEIPFIRRWIEAMRSSADPVVRSLGVLVRPHPYNGRAWPTDALADLENVAVWPTGGYDPVDEQNRAGFFDSMYHASAVVGVNTSAMVESAVVGRPVLSILAPEFVRSQGGTLHFHHLLPENGGFLRVASSLDEHLSQLSGLVANPAKARAELARFVRTFVRPRGVEHPATPILVDAIEALGRESRGAPVRVTAADRVLAVLLLPLAVVARWCPPEVVRSRRIAREIRELRSGTKGIGRQMPPVDRLRPGTVRAAYAAALAPMTAAMVVTALFVLMEVGGSTPFSYQAPSNIAEAAGMGLGSEVLRFLRAGADPNRVYPVRPDIISSSIPQATALEAAVWSRRVELVRMLDREGALPEGPERERLACVASAIQIEAIETYLAPQGLLACDEAATVEVIEARGR